MKSERRKAVIFIIFVLATVFAVAAVIAVSVYEENLHKHTFSVAAVIDPTCTAEGYTLNSCDCGYSYKSDFIDPLGHDYAEEFTVDSEPDCTNAGSKSKHCSRCESKAEVTVIKANGHTYGEWSTDNERTCTEGGKKTRTCSICGGHETQYSVPIGHDIVYETDEYYHSGVCARCKNEVDAKHDFDGTVCTACAYEVHPTQGLEYELNADGASYSVTGMGTATDADIVIFSEYNGLPVTEIGNEAFYNERELKSACMYGIEKIGASAFNYCTALEKVALPYTLSYISVNNPFVFCLELKEFYVDKANPKFHVKDNSLIETSAKVLRVGTTQSVIPADGSVTKIGSHAFDGRHITEITIPETVTEIGDYAFSYCGIENLVVPKSVEIIDIGAFTCSDIKSLELADGVKEIRLFAFRATDIAELFIPKSVESIGQGAFAENWELVKINVDSQNPFYRSDGNCIIHTASKTLHTGCGTSVIPADGSVEKIGKYAFFWCNGLTEIDLPDTVGKIEDYAFYGCGNMTKINLPAYLVIISEHAFGSCDNLTEISLGNSIREIGYNAFLNCSKLKTINYFGVLSMWREVEKENLLSCLPAGCKIVCVGGTITV